LFFITDFAGQISDFSSTPKTKTASLLLQRHQFCEAPQEGGAHSFHQKELSTHHFKSAIPFIPPIGILFTTYVLKTLKNRSL